jgi:hypothetical protein
MFTKDSGAFAAAEFDELELWEYTSSARDDSRDTNESIEMHLAQISQAIRHWKMGHADMDAFVHTPILGEHG